jgi:hypothetical protein
MAGCNECKFNETKLDDNFKSNRKCLLGFDDKMNEWWKNNGNKINEDLDDMECHEYNDVAKTLDKMNEKASEMLNLLKNR